MEHPQTLDYLGEDFPDLFLGELGGCLVEEGEFLVQVAGGSVLHDDSRDKGWGT